jgi:hypothetical protein
MLRDPMGPTLPDPNPSKHLRVIHGSSCATTIDCIVAAQRGAWMLKTEHQDENGLRVVCNMRRRG